MTLVGIDAIVPLAVWTPSSVQKLLLLVLGSMLLIAGISVAAKAGMATHSDTARIGFNVINGVVIAALGASTISFVVFGESLLTFLGLNSSG